MRPVKQAELPMLIQRLQWIFDPVTFLEQNFKRSPDFFGGDAIGFGEKLVVTSHPKAIQDILSRDRKQLSAPGDLSSLLEPVVGANSILMLSGQRHRSRRQLVLPPFHGERLSAYGELICYLAAKAAERLPMGKPFSARQMTQAISLRVIFEVVFGLHEGERAARIRQLLTETADRFGSPLTSAMLFFSWMQQDLGGWSPWGRFLRLRQQIDQLLYAEIRDRRSHPDPSRTDMLSLLMSAQDETGQRLSDQELRDELMTLLFAGHETTATAMAWSLYWSHRQPEVRAKLLAELATLGSKPDPVEIARLPYLTAVCQETLRRSPVAMLTFPRVAQEPVVVMGVPFDAGTIFTGCIYLTHQRPDLYRDPQEFRPERFLERKYSQYEFIPFGNGARRCVGEALALYEMKLVLATLLTQGEFELADSRPERPRRRGVTLAPARGVQLVLKSDHQASSPQPPVRN
ncbi:cytochrome P450 [Romeria aff. gracilis LEGE 07310]|uniref:Cytochrome P450 n=1 Tax=Vasconcelosia minhoensis LEGE 07310 TaxID=915328 RepID=A0A8J7AKH9_9CYAN|nr:cytochrome P450 [Romeria gracilis]MBE9076359.1 cytochrome P450 [Romeria aff. gracilis LEGE 07310]